jgi:hypothetical protein
VLVRRDWLGMEEAEEVEEVFFVGCGFEFDGRGLERARAGGRLPFFEGTRMGVGAGRSFEK